MSINKNIAQQVRELLTHTTDFQALSGQIVNIIPTLEASAVFPSLNQVESKEPELVYASLTVQDILQAEYFYSYLIKKPISKDSEVHVLKYGIPKQCEHLNLEQYENVMESRETLVCLSDFYQTQWVQNEWKGPANIQKPVKVKVSGNHEFRLGQKINAVCLWDPHEKHLIFLRQASKDEVSKHRLNFEEVSDKQEIDIQKCRKMVLSGLEAFCTKSQALMVLYSMISDEPMFINGENLATQLSQLLPRVCHIKIKAPFKESLFPYKNNQGQLIQTPMQMSTAKTFVIIDFSQFSNEKEIKIDQAQIDNLKALKMFVEEGKTIFRWEYGESLIEHVHSGIIVKGSKIITPHFHLSQQLVGKKSQKNPFKSMEIQQKQQMREYIKKSYGKSPTLSEQARKCIQQELKTQMNKEPSKLMLQQRMQIARLNAKSLCRQFIEYQDFVLASRLLQAEEVEK